MLPVYFLGLSKMENNRFTCSDNNFSLGSIKNIEIRDDMLVMSFEYGFELTVWLNEGVLDRLSKLLFKKVSI